MEQKHWFRVAAGANYLENVERVSRIRIEIEAMESGAGSCS